MNRNLLLAGSFATALHGLLFTLPRGNAPAPVEQQDAADCVVLRPFEIRPEKEPEGDVFASSAASAKDATPRSVDAPRPAPGTWTIPVEATAVILKSSAVMTPAAIGPRGQIDIADGPPGPIAAVALDRTPRARVQISPEYPPEARHDGRSGSVTVEFVVDESGRVSNARAIESTDPVFAAAAIHAVSQWRFEPGTVHGRIVRFRMAVPMVFHLEM